MKFTLIILCTLVICYQAFLFFNYFKVYAIEYLDAKPTSFNKATDRWNFVLSLLFILSSNYFFLPLLKQALNTNAILQVLVIVLNLLVLTIVMYLCLSRNNTQIQNKQNKKAPNFKEANFEFKDFTSESLNEIKSQFCSHFENENFNLEILIDSNRMDGRLNCISKEKNKSVGYKKIFELLDQMAKEGILDLFDEERKKLYGFIVANFYRNGQTIDLDNLKSAYCKWRIKNA